MGLVPSCLVLGPGVIKAGDGGPEGDIPGEEGVGVGVLHWLICI